MMVMMSKGEIRMSEKNRFLLSLAFYTMLIVLGVAFLEIPQISIDTKLIIVMCCAGAKCCYCFVYDFVNKKQEQKELDNKETNDKGSDN
jgi:hypothetical protein